MEYLGYVWNTSGIYPGYAGYGTLPTVPVLYPRGVNVTVSLGNGIGRIIDEPSSLLHFYPPIPVV